MTHLKLTLLFLIALIPSLVKGEDLTEKIKPFYESGVLVGAETGPFEITTQEGRRGRISVGYGAPLKQELLFIKIFPGNDLYQSLDTIYDEINEARIALMEVHPETMGLFGFSTAPLVRNAKMDVTLGDGTRLYRTGDKNNSSIFNSLNVEYTEDFENLNRLIILSPSSLYNYSGKDYKFKDIEKQGVREVRFAYGDIITTFEFYDFDPNLIKALKKAYKNFKKD